jgi:hypothetical protein
MNSLLHLFVVGDIQTITDGSDKFVSAVVTGASVVQYPAIISVIMTQPIFR